MERINVSGRIPAPITEVWPLVGDFGALADWHPGLSSSQLQRGASGDQVGDVRHCVIEGGGPGFDETQTGRSEGDHWYSYAIADNPLPMRDYKSTIHLKADGDHTVMEWAGTFEPEPGKAGELVATITDIYQTGIDSLAKRFSG